MRVVSLPMRLAVTQLSWPLEMRAVAQLGWQEPPRDLLRKLQRKDDLFVWAKALPQPGAPTPSAKDMASLLDSARNMQADYLLLFGGATSGGMDSTPPSILDITIIGLAIFPTHRVFAEAEMQGALIDTRTGRVVLTVAASRQQDALATSAKQQGAAHKLVKNTADKAAQRLGDDLVRQLRATRRK